MRCFVGMPLPAAYQDGLRALTAELEARTRSTLAWTRPGNWHLTLRFLGEVSEAGADGTVQEERQAEERCVPTVAEVVAALREVAFEPFAFQGGRAGCFPDQRRPRVLWIGLERGGAQCAALAKKVSAALEPLGFAPEERPFRAHLTLGRIKRPGGDDWASMLRMAGESEWPELEMDRMVLWRSILGPRGPKYVELAEFRAGKGSG